MSKIDPRASLVIVALLAVVLVAGLGVVYLKLRNRDALTRSPYIGSGGAAPVAGTLVVSVFEGEGDSGSAELEHETVFVNGPDYGGMEENDLRGFLDGEFRYRWNQPGQIHVRVGRRNRGPRRGEYELFRNTHRWADVELPAGSEVTKASLEIFIEAGPEGDIDLFLYEVKKDYDPGRGGVDEDNTSQPKPGEMWWGERAADVEPWALPGLGYASDDDPDADTAATPLAFTSYSGGDESIFFASAELGRYVERRALAGEPLLLLLKVADAHEDIAGAQLELYSGNHGDFRSTWRKPRLSVGWRGPRPRRESRRTILLEHGRVLELETIDTGSAKLAVSFVADEGHESPIIEMRDATQPSGPWSRVFGVVEPPWDRTVLRLRAVTDPVPIGSVYESGLKDTWVTTGPEEEQVVPWTFISPGGNRTVVNATYAGKDEWRIGFTPNELGRWHYEWSQNFLEHTYHSPRGAFDVVVESRDQLTAALTSFLEEVERAAGDEAEDRILRFTDRWVKLERAALSFETGATFHAEGNPVRELLKKIRDAIDSSYTR